MAHVNVWGPSRKTGFTLIELLVVIGIIGVLSSIVLVSVDDARKKARDTKRLQEVRQIMNALELYRADNGHYPHVTISSGWLKSNVPAEWDSLQSNLSKYLPKLPTDPINTAVSSKNPPTNDTGNNFIYAYYSQYLSGNYCPNGACYMIVFKLEKMINPSEGSDGVILCDGKKYDYNPEDNSSTNAKDRTVTWGMPCK